MQASKDYDRFFQRNSGYVDPTTQQNIRACRLLIAGCGIGSSPAVCAARLGFEKFVLVDGDVVDEHNLNRQFYDFADIGSPKVVALKEKLLRINPDVQVESICAYLDESNTDTIVSKADIVFDTVDFLDLPAILRLHASARRHGVPVFTALSVGFGALVWYFPADAALSLADILAPDMPQANPKGGAAASYAEVFASFIQRLAPYLDVEVVEQVTQVLTRMKDGKPCPASQVAVGSFAVGAMAMAMIHDLLAGVRIPASPKLIIHSFKSQQTRVVDLMSPAQEHASPRDAQAQK